MQYLSPVSVAWHICSSSLPEAKQHFVKASAKCSANLSSLVFAQYWSQGEPPKDVGQYVQEWHEVLRAAGVQDIRLYDKSTAYEYIRDWAPMLLKPFETAYHYAIEADVFRLALAVSEECCYVDIDERVSPEILHLLAECTASKYSTLRLKYDSNGKQGWIQNGFFYSKRNCPFFAALVNSVHHLDFSAGRRDLDSFFDSVGPGGWNICFNSIIKLGPNCWHFKKGLLLTEASNSRLALNFTHWIHVCGDLTDKHIDSLPRLAYKATNDAWQNAFNI